jgi:sugar O-acyltransferase (sialic acid O-acetyltransferase NeuD family)
LGCGGHARSVAAVALSAGFDHLIFVDENAKPGESVLGFSVQTQLPDPANGWLYIPCAGDNQRRQVDLRRLIADGFPVGTVLSPRATIDRGASLGPGCFVGHHAHIGPLAMVGAGCILNTGAIIEHDCFLGECSHVSVHACVAGSARLGDRVFLGAGAVVINGVSVASDVTIGAGGVVIAAIEVPGVYVGVPARRKTNRNNV